MRERLKALWQQARIPAGSGWSRLSRASRRLGRGLGWALAWAARGLGRALRNTFSWQGGLLAARWIVVLTVVAGLGYFLGRSRPNLVPAMPWEAADGERMVQSPTLVAPRTDDILSGVDEILPAADSGPGLPEAPLDPVSVEAPGPFQGPQVPGGEAAEASQASPAAIPLADLSQMTLPVTGSLGQAYAWRRDPGTQAWRLHDGVDLIAGPRQLVVAALPGRVVRVFPLATGGLGVWVEHSGGWTTRYESLSEVFVVEGQAVAQGQAVGRVGRLDDGLSLGVHFSLYRDGQPHDPARFLPALRP